MIAAATPAITPEEMDTDKTVFWEAVRGLIPVEL
jgi:hypothetical protein